MSQQCRRTPKERRRKGQALFAVGMLAFFLAYMHRVIPTTIAPDLLRDFSVSASALGFMISGYFYGYVISQPIAGSLADRLGAARVVGVSLFIAAAGVFVAGAAPVMSLMFLGRLIIGFGSGGVLVPALKIISVYFRPGRHGLLSGVLQAGGFTAGIVATAPYAFLVEFVGWRSSFAFLGGITVALAVVMMLVGGHDRTRHQPGAVRARGGWWRTVKIGFRMPVFWLMALVLMLMGATMMTFQGLWGVPFLMDAYGLSRVDASQIIMTVAIGFAASTVVSGYVVDAFSRLRTPWVVASFALAALSLGLFALIPSLLSPRQAMIICFLAGAGFGGFVYIFKVTPMIFSSHIYATNVGFLNMFVFLGTLLYQPLSGRIMDSFTVSSGQYALEGYRIVFALLSISLFACTAAAFLSLRFLDRMGDLEHMRSRQQQSR